MSANQWGSPPHTHTASLFPLESKAKGQLLCWIMSSKWSQLPSGEALTDKSIGEWWWPTSSLALSPIDHWSTLPSRADGSTDRHSRASPRAVEFTKAIRKFTERIRTVRCLQVVWRCQCVICHDCYQQPSIWSFKVFFACDLDSWSDHLLSDFHRHLFLTRLKEGRFPSPHLCTMSYLNESILTSLIESAFNAPLKDAYEPLYAYTGEYNHIGRYAVACCGANFAIV